MTASGTEKAILAFVCVQSGKGTLKAAEDVIQKAADRLMNENFQTKENVSRRLQGQFQLLEVQYNPSTLKFTGTGGDMELDDSRESEGDTVKQKINPGMVSLSMELTVDGDQTRERTMELLGRVERESDRKVIFCWGNMVFPGEMTQADARYTMFSSSGEPRMAKISVTIYQKSPEDSKYWKRAFESCFQAV